MYIRVNVVSGVQHSELRLAFSESTNQRLRFNHPRFFLTLDVMSAMPTTTGISNVDSVTMNNSVLAVAGTQINYNVPAAPESGKLCCSDPGLNFIYNHCQMTSIRLSGAGSPLTTSRPLKPNLYKNEEKGLGSGSSNLEHSRIGVMGLLKCYGAQEMVRLSLSLDRTSSLAAGQLVPERLSLRKSFIELRV